MINNYCKKMKYIILLFLYYIVHYECFVFNECDEINEKLYITVERGSEIIIIPPSTHKRIKFDLYCETHLFNVYQYHYQFEKEYKYKSKLISNYKTILDTNRMKLHIINQNNNDINITGFICLLDKKKENIEDIKYIDIITIFIICLIIIIFHPCLNKY